ncbi:hypothetical protein K435DRAFT_730287 [Dendrothele bispora CBS 962.96]|uniref:Uncharacterized protein n=1 Tax=Dendrothele bispora (strain CBS 962.96) TaxID=1314807 RepID=A0A4S8LGV9_DENBC|nr:hypothetical protein K435DRAFT_730287 [Dendrothele bispora CBS 962.96]
MIPTTLQAQSSQGSASEGTSSSRITTSKLEVTLRKMTSRAADYGYKMQSLEGQLAECLGNFRAIDSMLQETLIGLQDNGNRAERALNTQAPFITKQLDESSEILAKLSRSLPKIQMEVSNIRALYDSGRQKARSLVADLTWLNTEFYERWRAIIFTSSSPVSLRWKVIIRVLFTISFVICCWLAWIALLGGYRAYRHKLVWGERLIS